MMKFLDWIFSKNFKKTSDPADRKIEHTIRSWALKRKLHNIFYREGKFLHDLIVEHRLTKGLEIGAADGYSAVWIGRAMRKTGGSLTTLEIDERLCKDALVNVKKACLENIVGAKCEDAFGFLSRAKEDFDFIFLDAEKRDYVKLFLLAFPRILPGGVLVAHNTLNFKKELSEFIALVKTYPGLSTQFIEKWQGLSVSIRNGQGEALPKDLKIAKRPA